MGNLVNLDLSEGTRILLTRKVEQLALEQSFPDSSFKLRTYEEFCRVVMPKLSEAEIENYEKLVASDVFHTVLHFAVQTTLRSLPSADRCVLEDFKKATEVLDSELNDSDKLVKLKEILDPTMYFEYIDQ